MAYWEQVGVNLQHGALCGERYLRYPRISPINILFILIRLLQKPELLCQLQKRFLNLLKARTDTANPRDDDYIYVFAKLQLVEPISFPNPAADTVADHRLADLCADSDP